MNKSIAIICPTRGRNAMHLECAASFLARPHANSVLVFVVPAEQFGEYKEAEGCRYIYHPHTGVTGAGIPLNIGAMACCENYDTIGVLNDDSRFVTQDWEAQVLAHRKEASMVYVADGINDFGLAGITFIDSRIIRKNGFLSPPCLKHQYIDNFLFDLGKQIGSIRYLPTVMVEHLHPVNGKRAMDAQTEQCNTGEFQSNDKAAYQDFKTELLPALARQLRTELQITKRVPIVKFPGIEGRNLRMLITTPIARNVELNYWMSVMGEIGVFTEAGIDVQLQPLSNPQTGDVTQRQRNRITHMARKSKWQPDVQLCVDSDNGFRGGDIVRWLATGLTLVGLNCPKRTYDHSMPGRFMNKELDTVEKIRDSQLLPTVIPKTDGKVVFDSFHEVTQLGTGVLLIWIQPVYDAIIAAGRGAVCRDMPLERLAFQGVGPLESDCWQFWHFPVTNAGYMGGAGGIELGEDQNFCDLAAAVGHPPYCDRAAIASHLGPCTYEGTPYWPELKNLTPEQGQKQTEQPAMAGKE